MTPTFQYAGYYAHQGTGLNLTWFRAYDPGIGRWLSRDPLPNAERLQGPNLYEYCGNGPLIYWDPLGLAYFANGPLGALGGRWLGLLSQNPVSNYFNADLAHEQLFFEDSDYPSNVGYGPHGSITNEDPCKYHQRDGGYSDNLMRLAVAQVNATGQWSGSEYSLTGHNCQNWCDAVRRSYNQLNSLKNKQ